MKCSLCGQSLGRKVIKSKKRRYHCSCFNKIRKRVFLFLIIAVTVSFTSFAYSHGIINGNANITDSGFLFNGVNGYINTTYANQSHKPGGYSLSVWITTGSIVQSRRFINEYGNVGQRGLSIYQGNDDLRFYTNDNVYLPVNDHLTVGPLYNFIFVWNGTHSFAYKNATKVAGPNLKTSGNTTLPIIVGASSIDINQVWNGNIKNFAIYSDVLTQSNITDIFNAGPVCGEHYQTVVLSYDGDYYNGSSSDPQLAIDLAGNNCQGPTVVTNITDTSYNANYTMSMNYSITVSDETWQVFTEYLLVRSNGSQIFNITRSSNQINEVLEVNYSEYTTPGVLSENLTFNITTWDRFRLHTSKSSYLIELEQLQVLHLNNSVVFNIQDNHDNPLNGTALFYHAGYLRHNETFTNGVLNIMLDGLVYYDILIETTEGDKTVRGYFATGTYLIIVGDNMEYITIALLCMSIIVGIVALLYPSKGALSLMSTVLFVVLATMLTSTYNYLLTFFCLVAGMFYAWRSYNIIT